MADDTLTGLEVEEFAADEHHAEDTDTTTVSTAWPGQHRRKGSSTELPTPQRFLDLPIWMLSAPAKRVEQEEEETV